MMAIGDKAHLTLPHGTSPVTSAQQHLLQSRSSTPLHWATAAPLSLLRAVLQLPSVPVQLYVPNQC
jgi:hypothetical protein